MRYGPITSLCLIISAVGAVLVGIGGAIGADVFDMIARSSPVIARIVEITIGAAGAGLLILWVSGRATATTRVGPR